MDMKQEITDKLIALIEAGNLSDSIFWNSAAGHGVPRNFASKQAYTGINFLTLSMTAQDRGFSSNEWLTFKQAQTLGAKVKKGAKAAHGVFYKPVEKEDEKTIPILKSFCVFNVAEIEGLEIEPAPQPAAVFAPIERAEKLLAASNASITWAGSKAFFRSSDDVIYMPDRERFSNSTNAYAVALHELVHWTGHKSRLSRDFSNGKKAYAFEELVAELGAAYLVAEIGLEGAKLENHASYLQGYLEILKSDKAAIFRAAALARKSVDYLFNLENEQMAESEV